MIRVFRVQCACVLANAVHRSLCRSITIYRMQKSKSFHSICMLQRKIHVVLRHNIKHCKTVRAPSQTPPRSKSVYSSYRATWPPPTSLVHIYYFPNPRFSRPGYGLDVLMRLCEYSRVSLSGINIVNKQMPRAFMRVLGKGISRHLVQSTHSDS